MIDPLTELIIDIQHNGLRWVTIITAMSLLRKERRNHLLNKRDEALFHNHRIIMEALGRGDQWKDGPRLGLKSTDLPSLKQLLLIFLKEIHKRKSHSRRKNMNQNTNFATLLPGLAGVIKLILQSFGIEIPDQHINDILNGVAALAAVIAVILSHRKAKTSTTTETKTTTETTTVQPIQLPEAPIQVAGNAPVPTFPSTPNDHNQSY